jgi:hypothetical protein
MDEPIQLKYNPNMTLSPGTLMTVFKCPIENCGKKSCTDLKSFKLHCLHIHQNKGLVPIIDQAEAKYICQVEDCGKLYLEKKQYEIHQRHHKTYVPSKGRYFKCEHCDSKFNSQSNLDVHIIQVRNKEGVTKLLKSIFNSFVTRLYKTIKISFNTFVTPLCVTKLY